MKIKQSKLTIILILLMGVGIQGCSSAPKAATSNEDSEIGGIPTFRVEQDKIEEKTVSGTAQAEELETIPIEVNEKVEMWIRYFQGRGRPHMERYLARSTRYEALMKKVLRDNGLPEDLFYIALIESGFSSRAFSSASAVGYWQFIRGTGKRYKLEINQMVDERRDPVLATQAAADYFKTLYGLFDSWYLSMAAYNVGEGRVLRVVKKYKTRDFWELSRHRRALPAETDNYVPKYIAAKLIAKNPDKYGFDGIDYMTPIEFDNIKFNQPMNLRVLAEKMNVNYEDFKDLNPKFKGEIAPMGKDNLLELRIPPGMATAALKAGEESIASVVDYVPDQVETQAYRIKRGDTLSTIARRYRTTIAYLRELNNLPRKKVLRIGQRIFVPDRTPLQQKRGNITTVKNKSSNRVTAQGSGHVHIVQKGESLSSIATLYKVSVSSLIKLNNLGRKGMIRAGAKLILPENAVINNSNTSGRKMKIQKRSVAKAAQPTKKSYKSKTTYHRVKRGESLISIAVRYDMTLSQLMRLNNLKNANKINIGTRLKVEESIIDQARN